MRWRVVARLASVALVAAAAGVWFSPDVSADIPIREGWWAKWQQPTGSVGVTLPVTVPPPPTADPSGLTIARDVTGEVAVAAVYFQIPAGADATLYLDSAEGRELVLPPDADVKACVATSEWEGEKNGSWDRRPTWGHCESGTRNAAQPGFVFWLTPSMQEDDGVYSIVIVPGGSSPYMVNFAATSDATLVPGEAPPETTTTTTTTTSTTTSTSTTTTTPVETIDETDPLVSYEVGGARSGGGVAAPVTTTTTSPPRQPTTLVAFDPPDVPFPIPDSRAERIFAVSVLFFMATALWWLSGSPARAPRFIGALAGEARRPSRVPAPERGVGRFARSREVVRRPPRL